MAKKKASSEIEHPDAPLFSPAEIDAVLAMREAESTKPFRFYTSLEAATRLYQKNRAEGAALAVRAVLEVMTTHWPRHLKAPLGEAASILEAGIDPSRRAAYSAAVKVIANRDVFDENDPYFTKEKEEKILGSVIIELEMRCRPRPKLNDVLKSIVGKDAGAARKLRDYRNNLKGLDASRSERKVYDELIQVALGGRTPEAAAKAALFAYRSRQGKKS
jgi:hypothetical protein